MGADGEESKKKAKRKAAAAAEATEDAPASSEKKAKRRRAAEEEEAEAQEAPRKKKKKEAELAPTSSSQGSEKKRKQPPTADAEGGAETAPKEGKKARKKRMAEFLKAQKAAAAAAGDEQAQWTQVAEEERKKAQREIQQLVMRLRNEGKSKSEIEEAKRELKHKFGPLQKPDSRQAVNAAAWKAWVSTEEKQGSDVRKEDRKEKLEIKHDVAIIPIVWRGRHDKDDIHQAAADVKALLMQQGVDAWVDSRREYTPGQKFAHWEHRGVLLRVEVGPEDVKAGVCRVCRASTPGDYQSVERKRVRLPPGGGRALLLKLKEWGLSKIEITRRPGDSEDEEENGELPAKKPAVAEKKNISKATADALEDVEGNWAPREAAGAGAKKKKKKS
eukprot:gnl/TRDRNA2_/TRDRNA2_68500_c0_seq1.p1 gnl/TRDRNA2_/TRDRNA2_68500_c0~~gnl/TRDRNA2_/TRDRNA2_68500_c0_seq1.p1  ORF type:complete len:388 (+),score=136.65 gnl/TRDRNA2_/TRDRNA2_68500_c0_seq1:57-1220(+)